MADKTVAFRPFDGQNFLITGSESDAGIVGELERSGGLYQRDLAALLRRRLAPDAVVADVGAHIGVVTVLLAGLCPKGHVYAFEPVAENHTHLAANVAANGLENVTVQRAALFDTDGEIALEYDAGYPGGSHVGDGGAAAPSLRLDTWARVEGLDRLDLVKLDVEGVELAVLDGAGETLRRLRPDLVVECNPVALPRFGASSYAALLKRLRSLYPVVGVIGPGGRVTTIATVGHLRLILGQRGVVDLVGLPAPGVGGLLRERFRAVASLARLVVRHNRWRPPEESFVIDPGRISLRPVVTAVSGAPAQVTEIAVDVRNGSHSWLSSEFPHQPVNVSYRWLHENGAPTGIEGRRTRFAEPLAPGRSAQLGVTVELPDAPGRYTLVLTLVQERFAWLDEIDAGCTARLPATVAGTSA
ncbi:MAG TPA: FkbM family methyltransferase [Acidimicrobiia bacterium]|nr:FkbM family methyltransferase [Acidimicrobiia bacterium]